MILWKSLVYTHDDYVLEEVSGGHVFALLDGSLIREGVSGSVIASISDNYVREGASNGQVMYKVDHCLSDIEKCALAVAIVKKK